ncbi:MAG: DNA alkylation repair protein [Actinomycetes bacterium]
MSRSTAADLALIHAVRQGLAEVADPERAPAMQKYMKSTMPFYGVPTPLQQQVFRSVFTAHVLPDRPAFEATAGVLWDDATHREERYAAIALTRQRKYRAFQDPQLLGLYEHFVVTGAWWDLVDSVASRSIGPLLRAFHDDVAPVMRSWAHHDDLWRRRTSIIVQLGSKSDTDTDLLSDCIEPSLGRKEFFLRKAIGWALRSYGAHDPCWVWHFVDEHRDQMAPLSLKEATRNLPSRS